MRDRKKQKTKNGSIRHFELPDEDWEEADSDNDDDNAWKVRATPVYRTPQGGWKPKPDSAEQTLWFVPELNGDEDTDPNSLTFPTWVTAVWDSQAGRWIVTLTSSSQIATFQAPPGGILPAGGYIDGSAICRMMVKHIGIWHKTDQFEEVFNYDPNTIAASGLRMLKAMRGSGGEWEAISALCDDIRPFEEADELPEEDSTEEGGS